MNEIELDCHLLIVIGLFFVVVELVLKEQDGYDLSEGILAFYGKGVR